MVFLFMLYYAIHHPIYYIVYYRILFNNKKECTVDTCNNLNESQRQHCWNDEAILESYILYDSLYKLLLKRQTYIDRKTDQWLPGARDCENVWLQMYSTRDLGGWRVIEVLCILIVVVVTWICTCVKIHRTIYSQGKSI